MLPDQVRRAVEHYVRLAYRLLPGRLGGFYVVGSTALGAFIPGRSDIDFVAVLDRDLQVDELRRLRLLHLLPGARSALGALVRGQRALPGTCNGVFVRAADLGRPVSEIVPVASHTGRSFEVGGGFDVNPVMWKVFAERGIPVRGPAPDTLGMQPEPERLREWNLANLDNYWRPWAEAALAVGGRRRRWPFGASLRSVSAWGALGAPRLHCTIATGEVISKPAAGAYALGTFDKRWHPVVRDGLAYWSGARSPVPALADGDAHRRQVGEFVLEVVRDARSLAPTGGAGSSAP